MPHCTGSGQTLFLSGLYLRANTLYCENCQIVIFWTSAETNANTGKTVWELPYSTQWTLNKIKS